MILYAVMYKNNIIAAMINRMDAEKFIEAKIQSEFHERWDLRKKELCLYDSKKENYLFKELELKERAKIHEQLKADFSIDESDTDKEHISAMKNTINQLQEASSKILQLMELFNENAK